MRNDIIAPAVDSRGGKAEDRKAHTVLAELGQIRAQIPVVRAEIFTPRGNGVDLVDDDKTELATVENRLDRGLQQELWRQIDDGGLAAFNTVKRLKPFAIGNVRVNGNDILNATFPQVSDLVDHQGLQRFNDQRDELIFPSKIQCRDLKQNGLARTRGRRDKHIPVIDRARMGSLGLLYDKLRDSTLRHRFHLVVKVGVLIKTKLSKRGVLSPIMLEHRKQTARLLDLFLLVLLRHKGNG